MEYCRITFLGLEKWENHWLIPRPEMLLMPRTRVVHSLAIFLTKASLRLPCVFPSYIYNASSSFSFISSWLIIERDRETVACYSVVLASVTLSTVSLQAFLQSVTFNGKFLFPYIFISEDVNLGT